MSSSTNSIYVIIIQCIQRSRCESEWNKQSERIRNPVEASQDTQVTVVWDQQIVTDITTRDNKPDIFLQDGKGTHLQTDACVPSDENVQNDDTKINVKIQSFTY
jgi:hypothetical protein